MITVVGGIKGGSGKTTIATNIVVCLSKANKKVLFVDADEQKSASDWNEHRESLGITTSWTTVQLFGGAVKSQVEKMAPHYDEIVIDTGGRDTTSQRAALSIADIFIAPFQPRSLDVWTVSKLSKILDELRCFNSKLRAFALINRADPKGSDTVDSIEILSEVENLECLTLTIGQRKSFANAITEGCGVIELKPQDKKANAEMINFCEHIYGIKLTLK